MKIISKTLFIAACMAFASCGTTENKDSDYDNDENMSSDSTTMNVETTMNSATAVAMIESKSDSKLSGKVVFTETDGTVTLNANLSGLEKGQHAIHIHAMGDCSAHDAKSAGGHWNPTNEKHGKWGEGEFHRGDIGNITADEDGNARLSMETDLWCLSCDDSTKNIIGKSMMIHAGVDDLTSQPSGDAGSRVGCGVIELK